MADHDAVVVGAGFAGLYAVHKLRDELGLSVQGFDEAGGPGGTWYWNRYPGARCDFESVHYSYSFSDELQREWEWSERFSAQPEILSYLEWAADKLDVRKQFRFNTRVTSVTWDDDAAHWIVGTSDDATCTARFVIVATGNLSVAKQPEFTGSESFSGPIYRTSKWPHEPVDFSGQRVAVIGTGSTGIQVIPEIAKQAQQLTVFQRTANFAAPLRNAPVEPEQRRWNAENHEQVREGSRLNFLGAPYPAAEGPALAATPEERRKIYDEYWDKGGFRLVVSTFTDLLFDQQANDTIADYIRDRIRQRVDDPATAELLCPNDPPYATKRAPFETDYYETYNLDHVELVNARATPIESITPTGVRTTEREFEFDTIVLATGFDAMTGPLLHMGITGRDGVTLNEKWEHGPVGYLGIQVAGFPNLFTITGPQSAVALYNNPLAIEDHVDFATAAIKRTLADDALTFEPTPDAERAWGKLTEGVLNMTLLPAAKNSWYMGANIPGKPRAAFIFAGGAPLYRAICDEIEQLGFAGFAVDRASTPVPPMVRLDPAVALVLGALAAQGVKPLEQCTLEETRAIVETFPLLQAPGPDVTVDLIDAPRARVYVPSGSSAEPRPVVVFFHPGGWIAGSLEVADGPCRTLAEQLGAVVVSAGYRLAPEDPFPAATDDTFAAVEWARANAASYGGDPDRIVVMGESAGANLAAVAALRARDAGISLAGQILLYPPIDPAASTASRKEFAGGPFLSVAAADGMWQAYLSGAEVSAHAAPSRGVVEGAAPALVLTVELDPTRDEAEDYARSLAAAGVPVEHHRLDGLIHGVFNMGAFVPAVADMNALIADFVSSRPAPTPA